MTTPATPAPATQKDDKTSTESSVGKPTPFGQITAEDLKITSRDWDYLAAAVHYIRVEGGTNDPDETKGCGWDFIGGMLQGIKMEFTFRGPSGHFLPTACISYKASQKCFEVDLNPVFFRMLTLHERMGILLHEMGHMTGNHLARIPALDNRDKGNICADACINQVTPHVPTRQPIRGIFPEDFGVPKNLTLEEYYRIWPDPPPSDEDGDDPNNPASGQKQGQGPGQGNRGQLLDVHDWDPNVDESDILDAIEDLVRRTMIKTNTSYSSLPGSIQDLLEEIDKRRKSIDWKKQLKMFLKRHTVGIDKEYTRTRPNKRYDYAAPGLKLGELPKVAFMMDTSGSMSIIEENAGMDQADDILKVGMRKVQMVLWHTNIYRILKYKRGMRSSAHKEIQSGGTDFEPCAQWINQNNPDAVIVFTDGCFAPTQTIVKCPILFVISSGGVSQLSTTYSRQKMIKLPPMGE